MNLCPDFHIIVFAADRDGGAEMARYLTANGVPARFRDNSSEFLSQMPDAAPGLILVQSEAEHASLTIELVRQIRTISIVPCILHARTPDHESDRVLGLESGIDDWISSGATPREVLARVRAVLRRTMTKIHWSELLQRPLQPQTLNGAAPSNWRLSPERRELYTPAGAPCGLTTAEFDLFHILARKRGVPVTRDTLSLAVFRRPWVPDDRGIDNVAARLRRKLVQHSHNPEVIKPVRGVGYLFTGFQLPKAKVEIAI